jgi:hypothetical protein
MSSDRTVNFETYVGIKPLDVREPNFCPIPANNFPTERAMLAQKVVFHIGEPANPIIVTKKLSADQPAHLV